MKILLLFLLLSPTIYAMSDMIDYETPKSIPIGDYQLKEILEPISQPVIKWAQ